MPSAITYIDKINTTAGAKELTLLSVYGHYDVQTPTQVSFSATIPITATGDLITVSRYGWLDLLPTFNTIKSGSLFNTYQAVSTLSNGIILELKVIQEFYSGNRVCYYFEVFKNKNGTRTSLIGNDIVVPVGSNTLTGLYYTIIESPDFPGWYGSALLWEGLDSYSRTAYCYNIVATPETSPVTELLDGTLPPEYNWKAWTILQGNNGQYRQRLTSIKDNSIGNDISTVHYGTSNDFIFVAPNVDMVPYARNMNYNTPVKVAWSGINWMTMELQSEQGLLTNQVKAVFKLFAKNSSESTPIYQETRYFFIGSNNHFYLSFVTDDTEMVGAFLPVYYTVGSTGTPFSWGNATPTDAEKLLIWQWLQASGSQDPEDIPDHGVPYDDGTTDNGGGGGNPIPQDGIHTPNVPTLGAMASGMFTVYCPTDTQLGQIAAWLWTDSFIDNIKKYFNNASDNIISFYVLPLEPDSLPTKNFKVGNLENTSITGVKYLTTRFIEVDMGSVQIEKRWETYLDFAPYTKFSVYLPGVGVQALDTDDLMCPATMDGTLPSDLGSTISLSYVIDLMTGVLVVYVKINGQIRYQFPGKMGYQIPLTGENYTRMAQGFVTAVSGIAATVATAGTAAPFAASAGAAGIVNAMKPEVYRGGNLTGDASMLSLKTPLLIRSSPNKPKLDNQEEFTGFPSYKIGKLSEFTGYTEVLDAHVEGISCTDEEREKILAALKGGVII